MAGHAGIKLCHRGQSINQAQWRSSLGAASGKGHGSRFCANDGGRFESLLARVDARCDLSSFEARNREGKLRFPILMTDPWYRTSRVARVLELALLYFEIPKPLALSNLCELQS